MPAIEYTLGQRFGCQFSDSSLLATALTHKSASANNNERLEFLGDALLGAVIADWLYHRFPDATEGELTRVRSSLVKGVTLAKLAKEIDLGEFLILGAGEAKTGGQRRDSILADAMEAIFAVIYLENGLEACRQSILSVFDERLQAGQLLNDEKDPKTRLQEILQAKGLPLPSYDVICTEGDPHNQIFTVSCAVPGLNEPVKARASSRKKAEKKAAEKALNQLVK